MPSVIRSEMLKTRADIPDWLKAVGYKRLAEIGVRKGLGLRLLAQANPEFLIGVDLWSAQGDRSQHDAPINQQRLDAMHDEVTALGRDFWPFLRIIRKHSVVAATSVNDGSLDFVFIDADHTYPAVVADLAAWWPKVRLGGTISGHDYVERNMEIGVTYGVIQAVQEFAERIGLQEPIHVTGDKFPSWFITKTAKMLPE